MPPNDPEVARNINISRFATFALNISRRKSVKKKKKKNGGKCSKSIHLSNRFHRSLQAVFRSLEVGYLNNWTKAAD